MDKKRHRERSQQRREATAGGGTIEGEGAAGSREEAMVPSNSIIF